MDWLLKHKLATLVIILLIAGIGWYFLSGSSPSSAVLTSDTSSSIPPDAAQLVQSLDQLRTVTLDGTILTDPAFLSLQDFTTSVVPEPVGRIDPFAPLSAAEIANGTTTALSAPTPPSQ